MMKYHEQIKHPLWQKKRLEVLKLNGFECQVCGTSEEELHVHHPFYKRGAMIWQYEDYELQSLCHKCHKDSHAKDEEIKILIGDINICKGELIGVLKAMNDNPYTQLNSCEEIYGYLNYYGITGDLQDKLTEEIINHSGRAYDYLGQGDFKTSYSDIATACFVQPKNLKYALKKAQKITQKRIKSSETIGV